MRFIHYITFNYLQLIIENIVRDKKKKKKELVFVYSYSD